MYRISESMDWCELTRLSEDIGKPLSHYKARCQHGKTRNQTCIDCEGGYVNDMHTFAQLRGLPAMWNGAPCIAVSDDGEDVAVLPSKYESAIHRHEPIEQIKRYAHMPAGSVRIGNYSKWNVFPETALTRVLSRLRSYQHIEMQSHLDGIVLCDSPEQRDSDAWAFAHRVGARGVRFNPYGWSGCTLVKYFDEDEPRYCAFVWNDEFFRPTGVR